MVKMLSKHGPCRSTRTHDRVERFLPVTLPYGVLLLKLMLVLDKEGYRGDSGDHFIREAGSAV